jgi:uncharacterized protein
MRIGLISDTHMVTGALPRTVVDALQEVDRILHAGDLVTLHVLEALEEIAPVTAVSGNMDMVGVRVSLRQREVLEAGGRRIGLVHGHHVPNSGEVLPLPTDFDAVNRYLMEEFEEDGVDCIVYGHTHQARVDVVDGVYIVNPGSPLHGNNGRLTVAVLEIHEDEIEVRMIDLV